ncbi:MAG: saccharopine dehydrogenase family protein [Flavobacteriales bacterium]
MKTILVLGAGLSASSLLRYLSERLISEVWMLKVGNANIESLAAKYGSNERIQLIKLDASDAEQRRAEIAHVDLVISMLPASFHPEVARDCIDLRTDLITPSYVSPSMKALHEEALTKGVTIMNETGVDPGIDHMSAMKIMDEYREKEAKLKVFKSFCGGLIAPESDDNSWHYKFTWNPRNVVVAGQGGIAAFRQNKELKYIPYTQLFKRTERFVIEGYGSFDGYANRDSLKYIDIYNIDEVETIYRGTLRIPDFCQGWDVLIELGLTDDSYTLEHSRLLSPRQLLNAFLPYHRVDSVEDKLKKFLRPEREHLFVLFQEIGFFKGDVFMFEQDGSPAVLLQKLLQQAWTLKPSDKDMLVMLHEFEFQHQAVCTKITSSMVALGEDNVFTAMSNTVGLPIAMIAKQMLNGYTNPGVHIPVQKELYLPVLKELEEFGIKFTETITEIK